MPEGCGGGIIMLKDDQSEDLWGDRQLQMRGALRKKKVLGFVKREGRAVDPVTEEFLEEVYMTCSCTVLFLMLNFMIQVW